MFLKTFDLDDSGILLFAFSFWTNQKMTHIPVTLKLIKKVITNLDSSKEPGPNCAPLVVKRTCEPELSYILVELFNVCLKQSWFP